MKELGTHILQQIEITCLVGKRRQSLQPSPPVYPRVQLQYDVLYIFYCLRSSTRWTAGFFSISHCILWFLHKLFYHCEIKSLSHSFKWNHQLQLIVTCSAEPHTHWLLISSIIAFWKNMMLSKAFYFTTFWTHPYWSWHFVSSLVVHPQIPVNGVGIVRLMFRRLHKSRQ